MNRLSNYFKSAKLAKCELAYAEEYIHILGAAESKALVHTVRAMREMLTAMNNVASIAFNHKPKEKRK